MNKKELVKVIEQKGKLESGQGLRVLDALMDVIREELKQGNPVRVKGIGTFVAKEKKERDFVNPMTGQNINLKEKRAPVFYASVVLKDQVKGRKRRKKQRGSL